MSIPGYPETARRCATRAPRSWPIRTTGILEVEELEEERFTCVTKAERRAFPMESLSLAWMGTEIP
jgi:hypothetical protein